VTDARVVEILERWMKNQYTDPPTLVVDMKKGYELFLTDGRHRFKIAYLLGQEVIPLNIHNQNVEIVRNKLGDFEVTCSK
jgi:hypothetical protein